MGVEEAFVWLMRLMALKEMLQGQQTPISMTAHGGGCCCCEDLDDMNDLDDGQTFIWNRRGTRANHSC